MLRSGIRAIEAEIIYLRQVVKAREDPPHRAVLDTLGPARTIYLAEIALSGDPIDMAALEALEPTRMTTIAPHGPRCCVCGKSGIERPGSLPICDACYTFVAGAEFN